MQIFGLILFVAAAYLAFRWMTAMPGKSFQGPLPPLSDTEKRIQKNLEKHVRALAEDIGPRHYMRPETLEKAAGYIRDRFTALGFEPKTQTYAIMGKPYENLEVEIPGKAKAHEIVLIGAHYDSVPGSPGADDNASGIGSLLEIARLIQGKNFARTLRFVAFVNEEPPFFMTRDQGSRFYARRAKAQKDSITAMLCLESVAYYTDAKKSQRYPFPVNFFYPKTGNFIAFVGNIPSRGLVRACVAGFRKNASFPCEGAALPGLLPGISWSDHRSFWAEGYQAVMITDTVPYRNPNYHTSGDRPETLDFGRAARVTAGLIRVVDELAEAEGDTARQG